MAQAERAMSAEDTSTARAGDEYRRQRQWRAQAPLPHQSSAKSGLVSLCARATVPRLIRMLPRACRVPGALLWPSCPQLPTWVSRQPLLNGPWLPLCTTPQGVCNTHQPEVSAGGCRQKAVCSSGAFELTSSHQPVGWATSCLRPSKHQRYSLHAGLKLPGMNQALGKSLAVGRHKGNGRCSTDPMVPM